MDVRAVVDYSWARPQPSGLKARGYDGAIRYIAVGRSNAGKVLTPGERDALWAAGIAVGLVWETSAGRPLGGFNAGVEDARAANIEADLLDWPAHVPLAYAVDFDPTGKLDTIADYFHGVLSVPGRPVGTYGTYSVIERLATVAVGGRRVECFWQCAGWSGGGSGSGGSIRLDDGSTRKVSRHSCLYQDIEGTRLKGTDHNHVLGHVAFLHHPDHQPTLKEKIMANGVKLPDLTGQTVWLWTEDGVGRPRCFELPFPHGTSAALQSGRIDGIVELHGDEARWFHDTLIVAGPIVAEWQEAAGGVAQTEAIKDAVAAGVDEVLAAIEADDDVVTPTLPPTFATEVATAVLAKVGTTVEDAAARGVDRELDAIGD